VLSWSLHVSLTVCSYARSCQSIGLVTSMCADQTRKLLAACQPGIDLIICDEGQRLKSKDNKTTKMFDELRTVRRIRKSHMLTSAHRSIVWYPGTE
jgi:hypothetical protein